MWPQKLNKVGGFSAFSLSSACWHVSVTSTAFWQQTACVPVFPLIRNIRIGFTASPNTQMSEQHSKEGHCQMPAVLHTWLLCRYHAHKHMFSGTHIHINHVWLQNKTENQRWGLLWFLAEFTYMLTYTATWEWIPQSSFMWLRYHTQLWIPVTTVSLI